MLSEFMLTFLTLILSTWLFLMKTHLRSKSRKNNIPPEPWGFPVLGHLPRLGREPYKVLQNWGRLYGPVVGVRFGSFYSVAINNPKVIRDVLHSPVFTGRPFVKMYAERSGGVQKGILLTDGHHWAEQRRFALRYLRNFHSGIKSLEFQVQDEIQELIQGLRSDLGQPISLSNRFNPATFNALWNLMVGERFRQDDPHLLHIMKRLASSFKQNDTLATLSMLIPWIAQLAPKLSGCENLINEQKAVVSFIQGEIRRIQKTYVEGQPRSFMDAFMDEVNNTKDPESSFHGDQSTLLFTLTDLFMAGAETMSTTLIWLFAYLVHYPQVQEKLHQEILDIIGTNRQPCLADRPSMPYTEAVLHEVMRMSSVMPLIFHKTMESTTLCGFHIPKDTMVVVNLYSAHFNEEVWGDPQVFRPERFLDLAGKFKRNENLMPFSVGKRNCLAEVLARDQLFLFTTSLFQRFRAGPTDSGGVPELEGVFGVVRSPREFQIVLNEYL